jgi:hypothetical protein
MSFPTELGYSRVCLSRVIYLWVEIGTSRTHLYNLNFQFRASTWVDAYVLT